ncbi:hypothetical protein [Chroococcidiopsis sp.]|uniref:hypothetical protein n=1 Tax=Chroococcidiopsis sp. TaxID=3088168 RepID=UPI003F403D99
MRRKTKLDNINVTSEGIQFTFDTDSEARDFYKECQEKKTQAEIKDNQVTLPVSNNKITRMEEQ